MVVLNLHLLQVPYRRLVPISSFVQLEITLHRTCSVLPQAPPSLFTAGSCFGTYRKAYLAVLCGKVFETHTTLFWCETCGALFAVLFLIFRLAAGHLQQVVVTLLLSLARSSGIRSFKTTTFSVRCSFKNLGISKGYPLCIFSTTWLQNN